MKHAILNKDLGRVRTIIVLGVGRGGTSVISGTLRALGISMGTDPHTLKHEWTPVLYSSDGKIDAWGSYRSTKAMDETYEVWGWKSPRDVFQLETLLPLLRDPGFIVVTRDPLETSLSGQTYQDVPLYISLDETATVYRAITNRLRGWPWPALILPFAEVKQEPQATVDLLCSFAGLNPAEELRQRALRFIRPGSNAYRPFDAKAEDVTFATSPEDHQADIEGLAADLSSRYGKDYLRQLQSTLADVKNLTTSLTPRLRSGSVDGGALIHRLRPIGNALPQQGLAATAVPALPSGQDAATATPIILQKLHASLELASKSASDELAQRRPGTGYTALTRLHRVLQVAIRVRSELQRDFAFSERFGQLGQSH
ncbi:MAG: hypothetical protein ABI839_04640 [Verrucomicrobiota bacterium]